MTPYYADDHVTLYHARWEDVPPDLLRADVLVTDPPYGIGLDTDYSSLPNGGNRYAEVAGDARPFNPAPLLALGLPSVLFGANNYADRLPASAHWLVWDKVTRNDIKAVISDCELAWCSWFARPSVFRHLWNGGYRASEQGYHVHPTQKPVALMRWVLERCPNGTILDPYAGSGTTLVAAKSLNRKSIGVECVEAYCEVAANRLRQEVLGLSA